MRCRGWLCWRVASAGWFMRCSMPGEGSFITARLLGGGWCGRLCWVRLRCGLRWALA